jgi:glycine cleavage system regulatory protein
MFHLVLFADLPNHRTDVFHLIRIAVTVPFKLYSQHLTQRQTDLSVAPNVQFRLNVAKPLT